MAKPSESYGHQPAYRGLRRQAARCCEGVKAVGSELARRDIVPKVSGGRAVGKQTSYEVMDL